MSYGTTEPYTCMLPINFVGCNLGVTVLLGCLFVGVVLPKEIKRSHLKLLLTLL
jgi:hypothetical protein